MSKPEQAISASAEANQLSSSSAYTLSEQAPGLLQEHSKFIKKPDGNQHLPGLTFEDNSGMNSDMSNGKKKFVKGGEYPQQELPGKPGGKCPDLGQLDNIKPGGKVPFGEFELRTPDQSHELVEKDTRAQGSTESAESGIKKNPKAPEGTGASVEFEGGQPVDLEGKKGGKDGGVKNGGEAASNDSRISTLTAKLEQLEAEARRLGKPMDKETYIELIRQLKSDNQRN